jgi:hypothetical protein
MYLHFNLLSATCLKNYDNFFGGNSEFYWTWTAYHEDTSNNVNLARGFSVGCPLDEGYEMNTGEKKYRKLSDPRFTIKLPELNVGEEKLLKIQIDCWESDGSTVEVKKAFTNEAVETLFKIYEQQKENKNKAMEGFEKWINDDSNDFLTNLTKIVSVNMDYVVIAKSLLPLFKSVKKSVESNSDDLVGSFSVDLLIKKTTAGIEYFWLFEDGVTKGAKEDDKIFYAYTFREYNDDNVVNVNMLFNIFDINQNILS